jgi:hypothetical protein
MTFAYRILPQPLHSIADDAIGWFITNWGVKKNAVKIEEAAFDGAELRPTFTVPTQDHCALCVEVSEHVYASHLNAFVLHCLREALPVKLFIARSADASDPYYSRNLREAKLAGVGIIEISGNKGQMVQNALSLSLAALRPIAVKLFPPKYRMALSNAEQTFRDGYPDEGCAVVYKELEDAFRRCAKKCVKKGWWPNPGGMNIEKDSWANVIRKWDKDILRDGWPCPDLNQALSARLIGVAPFRNATAHKPKNQKELIKRDRELRTRFEGGIDLLRDFLEAAKPLKI